MGEGRKIESALKTVEWNLLRFYSISYYTMCMPLPGAKGKNHFHRDEQQQQ